MEITNILQKYNIQYKKSNSKQPKKYCMINALYCINEKNFIYQDIFENMELIKELKEELNELKLKLSITCLKNFPLNIIPKNIIFYDSYIIINTYNMHFRFEFHNLINDNLINLIKNNYLEYVNINTSSYDVSKIISNVKTNKLCCNLNNLKKLDQFGEINILRLSNVQHYLREYKLDKIINKINNAN